MRGRNKMEINSVVIFGNDYGIPQLIKYIPPNKIKAVVVAEDRPDHTLIDEICNVFTYPLILQPKINQTKFIQHIRAINPDLILVHSYSMKIPKEILDIPKRGAINIHFALLPKYRGANPVQWSIINRETETGVTMHYMTDIIDGGDIISQRDYSISFTSTGFDVINDLLNMTDNMLSEEIPSILSGSIKRTPQNNLMAITMKRRTPEDGEFSWSDQAIDIYNKIRALLPPFPGAFYYDSFGKKVIIDKFISYQDIIKMQREMQK